MENHPEGVSLARFRTQCSGIAVVYTSAGVFLGMPVRNTPQKTLESWKQIAAYLDRSERTVRRWEANEGLPVHRREHEKQDTVFAFRHEIEVWTRLRTKCSGLAANEAESLPSVNPATNAYLVEHDAITCTMHLYIAAARAGDGDLMRPAFHPSATISGYCPPRRRIQWLGRARVPVDHPERPGAEYQSSLRAHRDHREHCRRSSRSSTLVWQAGGRQCSSVRCIHSA